jgi:branched-chain amino acid transport system substrate-binding protein
LKRIFSPTRRLATASGVVALTVGLLGAPGASAATKQAHAAKFKGTIKVALVSDFTGDLQVASNTVGAIAYFDTVNAQGGVDGYKIAVSDFDTQSNPSNAATAMRAAIGSHPTAIVGSSFVLGGGLPLAAQSGLPVVGDGFAPGYSGQKNLFPTFGNEAGAVSDFEFAAAKKYAGASKIALLGSSLYASDLQLLVGDAPKAGVDLVMQDLTLPLVPNSAQILAAAQQIKASGAQAVAAIGVEGLAEFQIDLNQLGAHVHVISSDFYPGTTSENGLFYSEPWANQYVTGNTGVKEYTTALKRFGGGKILASSSFGPVRYAEAALLVQGLKAAGPPFTKKKVIAALSKVKNFTADGLIQPVSFPEYQKASVAARCASVLEVVNGVWKSKINGLHPFVCGS